MYVTGAVGQTHFGASSNRDKIEEGFIDDYMMPNMTAYNETCANLCNAMFSYRMLGVKAESKYVDIIELVLLNSGLSGISIEGKDYFYANPLRMIHNGRVYSDHESATETPNREPYLECFCCPPNLVRTIVKSSAWAYSLTENGIAVNLYGGNKLNTKLLDGSKIELVQETKYPWEGKVDITIKKAKKQAFDVRLRIPEWAKGTAIKVNGKLINETIIAGSYSVINRKWKKGDVISIDISMDIKLLEGNPKIEEVRNQVAIKRGPIVYCLETPDLPKNTSILDAYLPLESQLTSVFKNELLGGVTSIEGSIKVRKDKKRWNVQGTKKC